jgi:hypothetical protein
MYVHREALATTYMPSSDGHRLLVRSTYLNATTSAPVGEEYHVEDIETAEALEQENFSYLYGDEGGWDEGGQGQVPGEENTENDSITLPLGNLNKPVPLERWVNAVRFPA